MEFIVLDLLLLPIAALWFFLPCCFANMAPIVAAKFKPIALFLATPIDGGCCYRGHRILGDNKTWRGVVWGVIAAETVVILQFAFQSHTIAATLSYFDYSSLQNCLVLGLLQGLGALLGDGVESFIKRQRGMKPGERWPFYDQVDQFLGAAFLIVLVYWSFLFWTLTFLVIMLFIGYPLVMKINQLSYALGLKSAPY